MKKLAITPAKMAMRMKKKATAAQTTAILSFISRPRAIRIGDLPEISLAFLLFGSTMVSSLVPPSVSGPVVGTDMLIPSSRAATRRGSPGLRPSARSGRRRRLYVTQTAERITDP